MHKAYKKTIPLYLHNRPITVVKHCMEKIARSSQFSKNSIAKTEEGYLVTNKRSNQTYQTSLSAPRCSCRSWSKTKLPCKHMFAIIRTTEESWQSFPLSQRVLVYIVLLLFYTLFNYVIYSKE